MVESFFKNHVFQTKTWKDNLGWQDFDPQPVVSRTCFCFEMAELFWKAVGLFCLERLVEKTGCVGSYTEGKSDNRT